MTITRAPDDDAPLTRFAAALDDLQARFGPAVIAPPAVAAAPVAVLLPLGVRYCIACRRFRAANQMDDLDHCSGCERPAFPEIGES